MFDLKRFSWIYKQPEAHGAGHVWQTAAGKWRGHARPGDPNSPIIDVPAPRPAAAGSTGSTAQAPEQPDMPAKPPMTDEELDDMYARFSSRKRTGEAAPEPALGGVSCARCGGKGTIGGKPCSRCGGSKKAGKPPPARKPSRGRISSEGVPYRTEEMRRRDQRAMEE